MRRLLVFACAVLAAALAGCGFGEGEERSGGAELRITRDFGAERLAASGVDAVREGQTVMRLLQSEHEVKTRFGGKFVQAIDGLAGSARAPRRDWFYWVNGIEAGVGAADFELTPGDVVQWDNRRWDAAMRVPAIVGAYPEPFLSGIEGDRLPVRVECSEPGGEACEEAKRLLRETGVPATEGALGGTSSAEVLRVVVGRWAEIRRLPSLRVLEEGPARSGVFARPDADGERIDLLTGSGEVARAAAPDTGLVAAIAPGDVKSLWVLTGTTDAGVVRAARSLERDALTDAFAVAATAAGPQALPLGEGR